MLYTLRTFFLYVLPLTHLTIAVDETVEKKTVLDNIYDAMVSISGDPFNQLELREIALHPLMPNDISQAEQSSLTNSFSKKQLKELKIRKQKQLSSINMGKTTYMARDKFGIPVGILMLSVKKPMLTIEKLGTNPSEPKHQLTLASILASTIELAKHAEQKYMKIIVEEQDKPTIQTLLYLEFEKQENGMDPENKKQVWILNLNTARKMQTTTGVPKPLARPSE